ncbi:hypothetical protein MNBD_GAMMA08-2070 [hydrothermal vent metagenome]|uniref:SPOR domain-containing protein n=1 Tax=hydrothermal vent metagenome TaxID=652676 RepID=A0A3B0X457_9ZZZZ
MLYSSAICPTEKHKNKLSLTFCTQTLSIFFFLLISCFLFSSSAFAIGGKVSALQMPAWIERNATLSSLKPGMILQAGDKIITGSNARALLKLDEGSLIKVGENAELNFTSLLPAEEEHGFFEATLRLVKGAFRFTTSASGKNRKRQVNVKIGDITADIRGTDIWGRSKKDKDVLCLIEGRITANRQGEPEFEMEDPLSFYIVPKNKPASPVSPASEEQLLEWIKQTELNAGEGVLSEEGQWAVNLMSVTNKNSIKPILTSLSASGYAATIEDTKVNGANWYRLRVSGFNSRDDAKVFAKIIAGTNDVSQTWIVKTTER